MTPAIATADCPLPSGPPSIFVAVQALAAALVLAPTMIGAADAAMGKFGSESLALISETYESAEAFMFGRQTYEIFAPY